MCFFQSGFVAHHYSVWFWCWIFVGLLYSRREFSCAVVLPSLYCLVRKVSRSHMWVTSLNKAVIIFNNLLKAEDLRTQLYHETCCDVVIFYVWWHQHSQGHADGLLLNKIGHYLCLVAREKVEIALTYKHLEKGACNGIFSRSCWDIKRMQWFCAAAVKAPEIATALCDSWSFEMWEEIPFPGDGCVPSEKGGMEWAHIWLSWSHNELRAHEWEAPCACTASHGQNQDVSAAGCMMAALCHPAMWQPCATHLQGLMHQCSSVWRGIHPSAE